MADKPAPQGPALPAIELIQGWGHRFPRSWVCLRKRVCVCVCVCVCVRVCADRRREREAALSYPYHLDQFLLLSFETPDPSSP